MPCSQEGLGLLHHDSLNVPQLYGGKSTAVGQPDRIEPKLRPVGLAFDVNVWWLMPVS
jgi:hypothetical protein